MSRLEELQNKAARLTELKTKAAQGPQGEHDFSAMNMMKNIIPSAGRFLWDTASALQPFAIPGNIKAGMAIGEDPGLLGDYYGQRYGGVDNMQRTLEQDPVGTLADVSMVGGLAGPTKSIRRAAVAADPLNLTLNTAKLGSRIGPLRDVPRSMMESAVKLRTTNKFDRAAIDKAYDTIFREGLPADESGITQLTDTVGDIQNQKEALINASSATVPVDAVLQFIPKLKKDMGGFKAEAAGDVAKIEKYVQQFVEEMKLQGRTEVTLAELDKFKGDLHKKVDYNRATFSSKQERAIEKTQKAMTRGARAELENQIPEFQALNERQGALLDMQEQYQKRVGRIERRNPLTIVEGIYGGAGASAAGMMGMDPALGLMGGLGLAYANKPQNLAKAAHKIHGYQTSPITELLMRSNLKTRARQPWQELSVFSDELEEQGLL